MYRKIIEKLRNKKIAILGYGREGKSTLAFIRRHLSDADVTVLDQKPVDLEDSIKRVVGDSYLDGLDQYDLIIKTPGISLKDLDLTNIKDKITSQLELLLEVDKEHIIGITGTKGKSTTSSLVYEVLKDQLSDVYLLGNIGVPVLDEVENYTENTTLVIEMSSHQLEFIKESPHIAAILNLYQDHLDHAGSLEHYHHNKMNIFRYQNKSDYRIFAEDNDYLVKELSKYNYLGIPFSVRFDYEHPTNNATRILNHDILINDSVVYHDDSRNLLGDHNLKNIMFVLTIVHILHLDMEKASAIIKNFHGLKYRMEYIGKSHDVDFYNDTIATIPDATINAILSIPNLETVIIGGLDRGIDYQEFIEFLKKCDLKNIICMPTTGTKIGHVLEKESHKNIYYAQDLNEAYQISLKSTSKGAACILSPAAASYEFFKNFEEKGKAFEDLVKNN